MSSFKKLSMLIAMVFTIQHSIFSQKQTTDSIYYRNELSINAAPVISVFTSGNVPESALSIGYAHNFGRNHFLRTGIRIIPHIIRNKENTLEDYLDAKKNANWAPNGNGTVITDTLYTNYYSMREMKASLYIGYEHLVGRKKFKFLFGIDLMVGFNSYYASQSIYKYNATHTPDTVNNVYQSGFVFQGNEYREVNTTIMHVGFSPRLGMRYDVSNRIALTVVYSPLFYFDLTPYQYTTPVNHPLLIAYAGTFIAEAGFIVRL